MRSGDEERPERPRSIISSFVRIFCLWAVELHVFSIFDIAEPHPSPDLGHHNDRHLCWPGFCPKPLHPMAGKVVSSVDKLSGKLSLFVQQGFEANKHLIVRQCHPAARYDFLRLQKNSGIDNRFEGGLRSDPKLRLIGSCFLPQAEGHSVIDVFSNIVLVS